MSETPDRDEPQVVFKTVVIDQVGPQKISFIKLVRQWTGLGLKEAKDISEQPAPFVLVVCDAPRANAFRKLAEAAGATCQVRDMADTDQPVIAHNVRFGFEDANKSGCAGSACLLIAILAGGLYGLSRLL